MGGGQSQETNPFGPDGWTPDRLGSLAGKTYVITGTTTGCGYEAAKLLLSKGAQVLMLNRSAERSGQVMEKYRKEIGPDVQVSAITMDLAVLSSVREAAKAVLAQVPKIDALICNAAIAQVSTQKLTVDGFESQLGVNHFAHFLLCGLLYERVEKSNGRIVVVGSNGYNMGLRKMNFDDLNFDRGYQDFPVYCQSKLAQMIFGYELQRRVRAAGKNLQVQVCHPGASRTELAKDDDVSCMMQTMLTLFSPLGQSAEHGSWPEVMCATEDNLLPETYYGPTQRMEMVGPVGKCKLEPHALDAEAAKKLWTISEEKTGLKWSP
ncbi:RDH14 [Symbiodinium necroappetens]|uniref:RDH14 protein n=1 Tax=Symbiodinium necroappetens TaxID=1628268 RepID=A0A812T8W6_9DINO|nr:RDH14 [Symbiodinium necroappetens]